MTEPQPEKVQPKLANAPCFIEHQFPVAKVSMESYKERKAVSGQTLTGLGKWWGRKPLVLVRAALLGLLLPATDNPEKDKRVFLKLMTMDKEGLLQRKSKSIPGPRLVQELAQMAPSPQKRFLADKQSLTALDKKEKEALQQLVFERMPYSEKLEYCDRPEQIDGPSPEAWQEINAYLGTHAKSLPDLVQELGELRFGQRPRVGDAFCGGGSIPFEAARLGCNVYGSDLNPVAALLTWAALNLVGGGEDVAMQVRKTQEEIYQLVDHQVTEWGIEHNSLGWRADAYLYCVEVVDPESGWKIPLLPTLAIAPKPKVIARLIPDSIHKCYKIEILEGVSNAEYATAEKNGTVKDSRLVPPDGGATTPIRVIRHGMRLWVNQDFLPRPDDVFQERLYCIRWVEAIEKKDKGKTVHHYREPNVEDLHRELKVNELLTQRFMDWQEKGYIPSQKIVSGYNTDQPIRERGWTYWHHLFTPRQLLENGLFANYFMSRENISAIAGLLLLGRLAGWNSKLSMWLPANSGGVGGGKNTFSNQALNTMFNYSTRTISTLKSLLIPLRYEDFVSVEKTVETKDANQVNTICNYWVTDPPYADAINYEEISEFFLAWYEKHLKKIFPFWYIDSKRALAVKGKDHNFRRSMVNCYKTMANNMTQNGLQIVMFTHQDAGVWADLSLILWAAGLRVTAAWTIATETDALGPKKGNYVQGTVLLVLRKRIESEPEFLDEISHKVEDEVRRQLDSMIQIEDDSDPNFGDADYQLAAYAAALRVLTERPIVEIDPEKEILRERKPGEESEVEKLIRRAVKVACDHLVPRGLASDLWKQLSPMERFYLKGLEIESHAEYRAGVYQELARGFGAQAYTDVLESTKANETRLKSASEFGKKMLSGEGFASSLLRQCLFAISLTVTSEETRDGLNYLHTELKDYWQKREKIMGLLDFLAALRHTSFMIAWQKDAKAAELLAGAVRNDHI